MYQFQKVQYLEWPLDSGSKSELFDSHLQTRLGH